MAHTGGRPVTGAEHARRRGPAGGCGLADGTPASGCRMGGRTVAGRCPTRRGPTDADRPAPRLGARCAGPPMPPSSQPPTSATSVASNGSEPRAPPGRSAAATATAQPRVLTPRHSPSSGSQVRRAAGRHPAGCEPGGQVADCKQGGSTGVRWETYRPCSACRWVRPRLWQACTTTGAFLSLGRSRGGRSRGGDGAQGLAEEAPSTLLCPPTATRKA